MILLLNVVHLKCSVLTKNNQSKPLKYNNQSKARHAQDINGADFTDQFFEWLVLNKKIISCKKTVQANNWPRVFC